MDVLGEMGTRGRYLAGLTAVRDAEFVHCIHNHSHRGCQVAVDYRLRGSEDSAVNTLHHNTQEVEEALALMDTQSQPQQSQPQQPT